MKRLKFETAILSYFNLLGLKINLCLSDSMHVVPYKLIVIIIVKLKHMN